MSLFRRICLVGLVMGFAALEVSGCSSASNNDQGTSFLALGFYTFKEDSTDEVVPVSGANLILGPDRPVIVAAGGGSPTGGTPIFADGDQFRVLVGLQNRLTTQFIRTNRVDCRYEVQGADPGLVVPNDSIPTSFVLGPAETGEDSEGPTGSIDEPILPQVIFQNVDIITSDVLSFLNVNRNRLPELPFNMTVICTATGITQAGDVLTTNEIFFEVNFFDTAECCVGQGDDGAGGFQGGTGSGGDPDTFNGSGNDEEN